MKNDEYAVVIEKGKRGYGAYVPDLPVCAAFGKTEATVRKRIKTAIAFHIRCLRDAGEPVPRPRSVVDYVKVPLAS